MDYGILGEIVTSLTETVPELLNFRQKTQLILGLRAKVRVLEMYIFLCPDRPESGGIGLYLLGAQ